MLVRAPFFPCPFPFPFPALASSLVFFIFDLEDLSLSLAPLLSVAEEATGINGLELEYATGNAPLADETGTLEPPTLGISLGSKDGRKESDGVTDGTLEEWKLALVVGISVGVGLKSIPLKSNIG